MHGGFLGFKIGLNLYFCIFIEGVFVTKMSFLPESGVKSAVLEKSPKQHSSVEWMAVVCSGWLSV
jgi:hypothetical protein